MRQNKKPPVKKLKLVWTDARRVGCKSRPPLTTSGCHASRRQTLHHRPELLDSREADYSKIQATCPALHNCSELLGPAPQGLGIKAITVQGL